MKHNKKLKLIPGMKVEVFWTDIYGKVGWFHQKEILESVSESVVSSCGYYVGQHGKWIFFALNKDMNPSFKDWGQYEAIPKSVIIKIKKLG